MKHIKYLAYLCVLSMVAILASCTKQDAYKSFEKGGEISYPGKADSVIVHSGFKRLQLSVVLGNDPLVTQIKIYYNDRQDSLTVPVTRTQGIDTVDVLISNLNEGNYNFDLYTFDSKNNKSVVTNISGEVYGDSYKSSLVNRTLLSVTQSVTGSVLLNWGQPAAGEIGITLKYTDFNNVLKTVVVPPTTTLTELKDYKELTDLQYRSEYKPDSLSYDTYAVDYATVKLPVFERPFDKSKFQELILPTDVLEGGYGWLLHFLWDENYNPPGFATQNKIPCWFTFDMGVSNSINRFKMWQANDRLYNQQNVKTFEVWGSNNPNPDGTWDSWTKLTTCTSIKPSGSPLGTNTAADIAYAKAGEEFVLPAGSPKVRYIRIKCLTNWGNGSFMALEELTFYTKDRLP